MYIYIRVLEECRILKNSLKTLNNLGKPCAKCVNILNIIIFMTPGHSSHGQVKNLLVSNKSISLSLSLGHWPHE